MQFGHACEMREHIGSLLSSRSGTRRRELGDLLRIDAVFDPLLLEDNR